MQHDPKVLATLRKCLLRYGKSKGLTSNYADDFASESLLKIIEGRKASFFHYYVDFMRENFVTRSGKEYRFTKDLINNEPGHAREGEDKQLLYVQFDFTAALENEVLLKGIKPERRAVFILKHQWGLELKEIAFVLGLTESRICQILRIVEDVLKKRTKPE